MAVQHRLGLLPQRRIGIDSVDPACASADGKVVEFFHRTWIVILNPAHCRQLVLLKRC